MSSKNKVVSVTYSVLGGYVVTMRTELFELLSDIKLTKATRLEDWFNSDSLDGFVTGKVEKLKFNKLNGDLESVTINESYL